MLSPLPIDCPPGSEDIFCKPIEEIGLSVFVTNAHGNVIDKASPIINPFNHLFRFTNAACNYPDYNVQVLSNDDISDPTKLLSLWDTQSKMLESIQRLQSSGQPITLDMLDKQVFSPDRACKENAFKQNFERYYSETDCSNRNTKTYQKKNTHFYKKTYEVTDVKTMRFDRQHNSSIIRNNGTITYVRAPCEFEGIWLMSNTLEKKGIPQGCNIFFYEPMIRYFLDNARKMKLVWGVLKCLYINGIPENGTFVYDVVVNDSGPIPYLYNMTNEALFHYLKYLEEHVPNEGGETDPLDQDGNIISSVLMVDKSCELYLSMTKLHDIRKYFRFFKQQFVADLKYFNKELTPYEIVKKLIKFISENILHNSFSYDTGSLDIRRSPRRDHIKDQNTGIIQVIFLIFNEVPIDNPAMNDAIDNCLGAVISEYVSEYSKVNPDGQNASETIQRQKQSIIDYLKTIIEELYEFIKITSFTNMKKALLENNQEDAIKTQRYLLSVLYNDNRIFKKQFLIFLKHFLPVTDLDSELTDANTKSNDEDKILEEVIDDIPQNTTLLSIMDTFEYFTLETFKKRTTCIENPNFLDDFLEVIKNEFQLSNKPAPIPGIYEAFEKDLMNFIDKNDFKHFLYEMKTLSDIDANTMEVINSINDKTRGQSGWVELTDETNDKGRLVIRGGNQIKTIKRSNRKRSSRKRSNRKRSNRKRSNRKRSNRKRSNK